MTLADLSKKRVLLLGFGATNRAFYTHYRRLAPDAVLGIADQREDLALPSDPHLASHLGSTYLAELGAWDVIVRTPGIPYGPELSAVRDRVTTATDLFFAEVRAQTQARIIGVTGTKGKSTTSTLIFKLLTAAGYNALLLGNINIQDWDARANITDDTWIVYELSSYMLEDFTQRPDIAVYTTAFPDHVPWHGDYGAYIHAKARLTTQQTPDDLLIFNGTFEELVHIADHSRAFRLPFKMMQGLHFDGEWFYDGADELFPTSLVPLPGRHYKDNLLAMLAVAKALRIDWSIAEGVIRDFTGLPHRLERVATINGVTYYDDALSTTPESTLAALEAFPQVGSMILGGLDRGYDFSELAEQLTARQVPVVMLFPGARATIRQALERAAYTGAIFEVATMQEAVMQCAAHTPSGTVCLLSTATPSYDLFRDYQDQGDQFQAAVRALA